MWLLIFIFACFSISARKPNIAELAYLKMHEVPTALNNELNALFSKKLVKQFLRGQRSDEIIKQLSRHGFTFFNTKRTYVFFHTSLPDYIFKIRNEALKDPPNFSRIRFAQEIKQYCTQHNLPITVPHKWAYFNAHEKVEGIIVVAQRIDLTDAPQYYNPSPTLKQALLQLEKALNYKDFHAQNVIVLDDHAILIDTEKS